MVLLNYWSRRKRATQETGNDPLNYVEIPQHLRTQIILIFRDLDKVGTSRSRDSIFDPLTKQLRRELGVFTLITDPYGRSFFPSGEELEGWILQTKNIDYILDAIELAFALIIHKTFSGDRAATDRIDGLRAELNARFLEAAVGYQLHDIQIVQMSDEFNHKEVVVPTISLLRSGEYTVAHQEFLEAHKALRERDYSKVLIECHKAFESLLKVIAVKRSWGTPDNASASTLISAAFTSGFVPPMMQSEFAALRSLLESSVPTVRNKSAAHGGGTKAHVIPASLARLMLNQSAALLRFLAELDEEN